MSKVKLEMSPDGNFINPVMTVSRMDRIMAEHPDQCVSNGPTADEGEDIIRFLAKQSGAKCMIPENQVLWTI